MKNTFVAGKRFAVGVCMAWLACISVGPLAAQTPAVLQVPTATRVAGNTVSGYNGDYGSAINIDLNDPLETVFDASGNQYIADNKNNCIRKVTPGTPAIMSVLVGYEANSASTDTCNASSLTPTPTQGLLGPQGLTIDAAGDLFIADSGHNCIRELPANAAGTRSLVTVVDTCLNYGSTAATNLSVAPNPQGIILDPEGDEIWTSYVPALGISQVMFHRQLAPADPPSAVCDIAGTPVAGHSTVCTFYNGQSTVLNDPTGLAIDAAGNYYVSDTGNGCVRELTAAQNFLTPIGQCASDGTGSTNPVIPNFAPAGLAAGPQGYLYITNPVNGTVLQYQGQETAPVLIAGIPNTASTPYTGAQDGKAAVVVSLNQPAGLSVDPSGNLYVADSGNGIIRQLAYNNQFPSENLNTPSGGQNLQFEINSSVNLAATFTSEYGVSLGNNTCAGPLSASSTATPTTCVVSVQFDPQYPGPRRAPLTLTDSSSTPAATYQFGLSGTGIGSNALFIPGSISTPLASLDNPTAVVVGTTGNVYIAESGATSGGGDIQLVPAGSQTAGTFVPAGKIQSPVALALDAAQNLYVADTATNSIFKVDANGNVTTFASGLNGPAAVSIDSYGNVYVAQNGAGTEEVLKIFAGGQQAIIAGGGTNTTPNNVPATQAQFVKPSGLYLDPSGILYISDEGAYRVYSVDNTGTIHYFAGNGTQTNTANPVTLPTDAGLEGPTSLVGDAAGDIYITDGAANLIYVVFGGSNQNPGIEALVGTGTAGNTGDGGAANLAELNNPVSVSLDGADDLYLIDSGNNSVRKVNYQDPTLNFGYVKPGNSSGPLITQLWDAGNQQPGLAPLTGFTPVETAPSGVTGAFTQVSNGCGSTLPTGSTCSLSYSFTAPYNPPATPVYGLYEALASSNAAAVDIPQVITLVADVPQITFVTPPVTAVYGTSYALTATITDPAGPAPTGTVTFAITGASAQTLCGGPITLPTSGSVSCPSTATPLDVGTYPVLVTYSGDSNYLSATQTTTLTITPAPVVITAANFTRPYNTPNPTFTGTITGVVAGQSITDTYSTTATQTSAPGTYPITPGNPAIAGPGTSLSNYAITYVNGTLTITQNSGGVTISSPAVSTVYGTPYTLASAVTSANTPTPTGTATFTIGSQTLCAAVPLAANGSVSCSPSPTLENVGTYSVSVAYSGDSFYPASSGTIALTITPAPVTVAAGNATRPFGTPNPTFTGTVTGVVAGQSITDTYTTTATQTSSPGSYPITPTAPATAGTGTLLTNYTITYVPGTLTITQASGPVFSTPAVTTVYGTAYTLAASVTSATSPAPTGTVTFTIGGQTICPAAMLSNGTVTCTPSATLENAGSYGVTVAYSGDANYPAVVSTLELTITPAPVTVKANNATRTTGVANPAFSGVITGVVTGQSITATYATPATESSPAGNYPIIPTPVIGSGTLAANYSITVVNGILTVTQASTGPTSPVGSFTLKATPPEQEIDTTGSVNFPVSLTSVDGFTDTVAFSCSGLPEGVGCSFAPGALTPVAGGTSVTVMTITGTADGTNVPNGSFGALRPAAPFLGNAPSNAPTPLSSLVLAWTMLPIGFTGSAASLLMGIRRGKGDKKNRLRSVLWILPLLLFVAGLSGCGAPNNYKIYTVTITATDSTYAVPVSQSTTVQLVLAK